MYYSTFNRHSWSKAQYRVHSYCRRNFVSGNGKKIQQSVKQEQLDLSWGRKQFVFFLNWFCATFLLSLLICCSQWVIQYVLLLVWYDMKASTDVTSSHLLGKLWSFLKNQVWSSHWSPCCSHLRLNTLSRCQKGILHQAATVLDDFHQVNPHKWKQDIAARVLTTLSSA